MLGNIVGSHLAGVPTTWDMSVSEVLYILAGNGLGLLMGFTLGVLFRNSAAAIVGYFVYAMVLPTLSALLAGAQDWYPTRSAGWTSSSTRPACTTAASRPRTGPSSPSPAPCGCCIPLAFGLWRVLRSEVK